MRQLAVFTNRSAETHILEGAMRLCSPERLIHVRGIAGIGKSMLLTAWEELCRSLSSPYARINLAQQTPESIVTAAFTQLSAHDDPHESAARFRNGRVAAQLTHMRELRSRLEVMPNITRETISAIQGSYSEFRLGDADLAAERVLSELSSVVGRTEAEYILNPTDALTDSLVEDLAMIHHPLFRVCLFFDQYEQVSEPVDTWIRSKLFPRLSSALVVTCGRNALSAAWRDWISLVTNLELHPLSREDTAALVRKGNVSDDALVARIVNLSAGVPLAAGLAVDVVRRTEGELDRTGLNELGLVQHLVRLFLTDIPQELVQWVQRASIVRWFNEDTLQQMAENNDESSPTEVFSQLADLSFIQLTGRGVAVHDAVREFLNQDLRGRAPSRYRELNRRAYENYTRLLAAELSPQDAREFEVERLYHLMRADQAQALIEVRNIIESTTLLSQVEVSEAIMNLTREVEWSPRQAQWLTYLDGIVKQQRNTDNRRAVELLLSILESPSLDDPELRLRAASYVAMTLWYFGQNAEVLRWADEAIRLSENRAGALTFRHIAIEARGLTFNRLGRHAEALAAQHELLDSARASSDRIAEAWALNNIGYALWHVGDWTGAISFLNDSERTFSALGHPYGATFPQCHKSLILLRCESVTEAGELLSATLARCRETGNREIECKSLQNLVDYFLAVGDRESAIEAAAEALDLARKLEHPFYRCDALRRRANIHLTVGNYQRALEDFQVAGGLARQMGAYYKQISCELGQATVLHRTGDPSVPPLIHRLQEVTAGKGDGYEELRSQVLRLAAISNLEHDSEDRATELFIDSIVAASEYNSVAMKLCAQEIHDACVTADRQQILLSVEQAWATRTDAPDWGLVLARAHSRTRGLAPSVDVERLLRSGA